MRHSRLEKLAFHNFLFRMLHTVFDAIMGTPAARAPTLQKTISNRNVRLDAMEGVHDLFNLTWTFPWKRALRVVLRGPLKKAMIFGLLVFGNIGLAAAFRRNI